MLNSEGASEDLESTTSTIDKIALALDCPIAAFSETVFNKSTQTVELLHLWSMMTNDQDRLTALSYLRGISTQSAKAPI